MIKNEDIAREAGVSTATVSRVLNNVPGVSPTTREAVLSASKRLGRAVSPEITRKRVLAACFPWSQDLMAPLMTASADFNLSLLFKVISRDDLTAEEISFDGDFDGVLLIDSPLSKEELLVLQKRVPVVQCRNYNTVEREVSALVDDVAIGYELTSHLIETGKRRIAFAHFSEYTRKRPYEKERLLGYYAALTEHSLSPAAEYSLDKENILDQLLRDANHTWDALILPEPVPDIADLKQALEQAGHRIPGDVALAVLGDGVTAERSGITAMCQPLDDIARGSLFLLSSLMEQSLTVDNPVQLRYKPELIVRASTAKK